jgi:hypothetical protein
MKRECLELGRKEKTTGQHNPQKQQQKIAGHYLLPCPTPPQRSPGQQEKPDAYQHQHNHVDQPQLLVGQVVQVVTKGPTLPLGPSPGDEEGVTHEVDPGQVPRPGDHETEPQAAHQVPASAAWLFEDVDQAAQQQPGNGHQQMAQW